MISNDMVLRQLRLKYAGFTLVEILVVLAIIGILIGITTVSFTDARRSARDDERQTSLKELALAIERYRLQYGQYPAKGCGVTATWVGPGEHDSSWGNDTHCEEWIVGLVPDFISELPRDPSFEDVTSKGYLYSTNASSTAFKVMVHDAVEVKQPQTYDDPFARCPRDCGAPDHCSNTAPNNPQRTTYAIYSPGAECW
jgi:type II secretion system protein G